MEGALVPAMVAAAGMGVGHTLLGPDHYIPFIVLGRAHGWSAGKTLRLTLLCGLGHILSSVLLSAMFLAAGFALADTSSLDRIRGSGAAWALIGLGTAYTVWGFRNRYRRRPHAHLHAHADGTVHSHSHNHTSEHAHVHNVETGQVAPAARLTPWILFLVFVFGPCEPLIPLLLFAATQYGALGVGAVFLAFGVSTLGVMAVCVQLGLRGARLMHARFEPLFAPLAGLALTLCGVASLLLDL
jgi:ABC-type nickel/cobalt efflux system permease component RcnA